MLRKEIIMKNWVWRIVASVAAIALLGSVPVARADTISVSFVSKVGPTYSYLATLSVAGAVAPGDGFTIFDFALPTGVFTAPLGWGFSTSLSGSPIPGVAALGTALSPGGDSGAIDNVHFVYGGPLIPAGPLVLGLFTVDTSALFTGADIAVSKDSGSDLPFAFGPLPVASVVPLPAAAWAGMALMGLIGAKKFRNSRREQLA
jgi:hypothetical protein